MTYVARSRRSSGGMTMVRNGASSRLNWARGGWQRSFFGRWARLGAWERLLELAQRRGGVEAGMAFLDGTSIRAHHKAASAAKKGGRQRSATPGKGWAVRAAVLGPKPV